MDFQKAKAKAEAIVSKHSKIKSNFTRKPTKTVNIHVENLPTTSGSNLNESDINKYMNVLRKTHYETGAALLKERLKKKAVEREKKRQQNVNIVKARLSQKKNEGKHLLRNKIKQMRIDRQFPLPKSFTNYKNRKGLLKKNSIVINKN